ncbi:SiaB family protein kinase [Peristeroidobacter soli]|uniref:SiaB family protein kinase n=1 Tax=Peristeroidobacter soli TaxID=2497877 RepID=UPI00101BB465|nr:SiaB family protein kinase [Peristeroidobacter soli]
MSSNVAHRTMPESSEREIFSYSGAVSAGIVGATGETLRARLASLNVDGQRARKIFSSFVELAYNIIHHGEPEGARDVKIVRCGAVAVWQREQRYHLRSQSLISADNAPPIAQRLQTLRDLTPEQIRFEFRLRLTNLQYTSDASPTGGAGLGLLTIARNAVEPIDFELVPVPSHDGRLQLTIHTVVQ